jgi:hypothetical protein
MCSACNIYHAENKSLIILALIPSLATHGVYDGVLHFVWMAKQAGALAPMNCPNGLLLAVASGFKLIAHFRSRLSQFYPVFVLDALFSLCF